ncbi:caspase family protein [Oculatella sp. LEGE 06141]|uniref:caspase family protein n=1 Tax=Oculatella sp. LEGE 06141 TaxID=1828648 RepID=UPI0018808500|nr:caspase family protein [Oculatella sp. LEGE 06141]MBE9178763.1 caspase family protein [Oculatella sp. LEGE 06141]
MGLKRRTFLQQAGLALSAWGISETGLSVLARRYQQVLAQPTRRKLALLVGINQYAEQVCDCTPLRGNTALNGCLTDVALQQEVLIHRFGFQPSDILTLTDQQATREAIETAFLSHLTEQARPGDVVVFHFSGLGSQVKFENAPEALQNTLVPVDGILPSEENPTIHDLQEETLVLLLRSLQTDQVTTVLDASFADFGRFLQGNLRIRSRPNAPSGYACDAELAFQEQLLTQTKLSREQVVQQWRSGQLPGIMLTAAGANQIATEGQWNGFSAGLFTYALTQQLWWTTPVSTLRINLGRAIGSVKQLVGSNQLPALSGQKSQEQVLSAYYTLPTPASSADGVVTAVEEDGKTVQLWLAGLPASVLEYYGTNSLLSLYQPAATPPSSKLKTADEAPGTSSDLGDRPLLQVRSRDGLTVKARVATTDASSPPLQVGQLVQESVRLLPRNISLTVALDTSLERIERVDATSAFASIPRVSSVVAGEQPADYLFGKNLPQPRTLAALADDGLLADATQPATSKTANDTPAAKSSYGLFYPGRAVIPGTLVEGEEAVKTAVNRLTPQLRTLLATKLLRLTVNEGSSRLGVRAVLEMVSPQERIVMLQETVRAPWSMPSSRLVSLLAGNGVPTLPIGSHVQFRLSNYGDRPVYFILLGLDTSGSAIALYPASVTFSSTAPRLSLQDNVIPPEQTITIPQNPLSDWIIQGPTGFAETYLIFSRSPLTQAFAALETAMRSKGDARQVNVLLDPLKVAQAVLRDLHQAGAPAVKADAPSDSYALDVDSWATLSFIYRVAEA